MPAVSTIRVLVAVEDAVAANGLQTVLGAAEGIECLPLPERSDDIRGLVAADAPDVLILDVELRRADRALLVDLVAAHPGTRVLVYLDHSPLDCGLRLLLEQGSRTRLAPEALARVDDCCLTSLRQHAHGCLGTGVGAETVVQSVRSVAAGDVVAAPWLTVLAGVVQSGGVKTRGPAPISVRELEIVALLAEGLSNKQIGERLDIREQTVKNHVTRAMEKLGVRTRLEVGLFAARHNLRLTDAEAPEA